MYKKLTKKKAEKIYSKLQRIMTSIDWVAEDIQMALGCDEGNFPELDRALAALEDYYYKFDKLCNDEE